jgi:hypothetical protein
VTRTFRYCVFSRLDDALRMGWIIADSLQGSHHGDYAVLVEWLCPCAPPWFKGERE